MNLFAKLGIGLLGSLGVYKAYNLLRALPIANEMEVDFDYEVKSLTQTGITVNTIVKLTNPTTSTLTITQPYVKIYLKDEVIVKSLVLNHEIELKPQSETRLRPVTMTMKWSEIMNVIKTTNIKFPPNTNFFSRALWLMQNYKTVLNSMGIEAEYSTYVNGVFIKDKENMAIPPKDEVFC